MIGLIRTDTGRIYTVPGREVLLQMIFIRISSNALRSAFMTLFVDTQSWPIVRLTMPEHVPDGDAEAYVERLRAVYTLGKPFVLFMAGAELPRHSPAFMQAYGAWAMASMEMQRRLCRGAVRIEPDAQLRGAYRDRAAAAASTNPPPYPYEIVADEAEATALAEGWLAATPQS